MVLQERKGYCVPNCNQYTIFLGVVISSEYLWEIVVRALWGFAAGEMCLLCTQDVTF